MKTNQRFDTVLSEVSDNLQQGRKRITVLMPNGTGKTFVMGQIIRFIGKETIVLVSRRLIRDNLILSNKELLESNPVSIITVNDYLQEQKYADNDYDYSDTLLYMLYETTPNDRVELSNIIPIKATVISFGPPHIDDKHLLDTSNDSFACFVFHSENIFDVRDLISASESERNAIIRQISDKKKKQDRLLYAIRTIPFNASPEASWEEIEYLREKIKERDREIALREATINVLKELINASGIPTEQIRELLDSIKRTKCEYIDKESELMSESITKAVAEECQEFFARYKSPYNEQYYSSLIEDSITSNVWNKMSRESKNCLITGKTIFQSMLNTNDDLLDYSGVCILASKSLDIEMSKRFFHKYVMYLRRTRAQNRWPNTLFKDGHLLSDEEFTLGSVKYVVGINKAGEVKNHYVNRLFLDYASSELYESSLSRGEVEHHLQRCIEAVETVRENYRNPAAHRVSISRITAQECFDYLIDTYKKLKEILEYMR